MGFNYAKERGKFEAEWRQLRKEYKDAGMDEHAIEQLYLFDLKVFCSGRVYANHTQQMPDMYITENLTDHSSLLKKFNNLSVTFDEAAFHDRYAWIETVEDSRLSAMLRNLSQRDLELLTFLVIEGHTQQELAERWSCSQRFISKCLQKIKNLLK